MSGQGKCRKCLISIKKNGEEPHDAAACVCRADGDLTIAKLLKSKNAEVVRFTRFQLGEGIEKKQDDLAAEVAKQLNQ